MSQIATASTDLVVTISDLNFGFHPILLCLATRALL
jgi:hypothetical protein